MLVAKFRPYNANTLANLINKEVKFSTVFDFNDFNEYGCISCNVEELKNVNGLIDLMKKDFQTINFKNALLKLVNECYRPESIQKVEAYLGRQRKTCRFPNSDEINHLIIAECLAYTKVGIFSCSRVDVYKNASAEVMFAHYGDNLKGVALLYEINKENSFAVEYQDTRAIIDEQYIVEWDNGVFHNNMKSFLRKAKEWKYENEIRLFQAPKLQKVNNIKLKSILYTPRFSGCIKTLNCINEKYYESELKIEQIFASNKRNKIFKMCKGGQSVSKWIKE